MIEQIQAYSKDSISLLNKVPPSLYLKIEAADIYAMSDNDQFIPLDLSDIGDLQSSFKEEGAILLAELDELYLKFENDKYNSDLLDEIYRKVHTLKAGFITDENWSALIPLYQKLEDYLGGLKNGDVHFDPEALVVLFAISEQGRILLGGGKSDPSKNDRLLGALTHMVGNEGMLSGFELGSLADTFEFTEQPISPGIWVTSEKLNQFATLLERFSDMLNKLDSEPLKNDLMLEMGKIRSHLDEARFVKLSQVTSILPKVVRQTCLAVRKKVTLSTSGLSLNVDFNLGATISNSLIHIVRNSIDHGIELREDRIMAGKSEQGQIEVSASLVDGWMVISVSDDGAGIKIPLIKAKIVKQGLAPQSEVDKMSDQDAMQFIFHSGFSTREQVSEVSGRGVGMDFVASSVKSAGGKIEIETELDKGTKISLFFPMRASMAGDLKH